MSEHMSNKRRNINGKRDKEAESNSWKKSDNDIINNSEDSAIFNTYREYMKGRLDLEEVMNDPSIKNIENDIKHTITEYNINTHRNEENEAYIRDCFKGTNEENNILKEIDEIERDIRTSNVNEQTTEWVNDFRENKRNKSGKNPNPNERTDFITSSLADKNNETATNMYKNENNSVKRSLVLRYISISAASVAGLFVLLKILLPSSDPEKLFKTYYTPFNYVSSATREAGVDIQEDFIVAVEQYKIGDYNSASTGFSNIIMKDSSFVTPRFLLGLTNLELGEYDKAINLFNSVKDPTNKYYKETLWYLGLVYLRTGEKTRAANCFEILASSSGFYYDQAKKILRRLK